MGETVYLGKYRNLGHESWGDSEKQEDWIFYGHAVGDKGKGELETYFNTVKDGWDHIDYKFEFEIKPETDPKIIEEVLVMHKARHQKED
jgi:hypothetical protein